jgi:hypothetical protein
VGRRAVDQFFEDGSPFVILHAGHLV